jgi:competence protein ComFC
MRAFALQKLWRDLADLGFPGECVACRAETMHGHVALCRSCEIILSRIELRPQCTDCGAPLAVEYSPCQRCLGRGYRSFEHVVNLGVFEATLATLIRRMKFAHGWSTGELLANRCKDVPRVAQMMQDIDVIVHVPLHWKRQIWRGFDQSQIIARRLGRVFGKPTARPVIRLRATDAQSLQTSRLARARNVRDAFALVNTHDIRSRHVLIVDDVMTTGSTLKSFARALRPARAASLSLFTLAVADPKGYAFEAL